MAKSLLRITEEAGATFATLAEAVGSLKDSFDPRVLGPIVTEAAGKPGSKWAVIVIQEGTSLNRVHYSADVLKRAVSLYENSRVFWNHDNSTMRDPRNLAGFIKEAALSTLPDGKTAITGVLVATSPKLREMLLEAHEAGNPNLFGLSHTVAAETERAIRDGQAVTVAKTIKAVESVDVVSFPSAGGRVMRLAAGSNSPIVETQEGLVMLQDKIKKLKESRPDLAAKLGADPTEAQVDALLLEAISPAPAPAKVPDAPVSQGLSDADRSLLTEAKVERMMVGKTIPAESRAVIRESLIEMAKAGVSDAVLSKNLDAHVVAAAKLSEAQPTGAGGPTIEQVKDEAQKVIEAWEGFFAGDPKGFKSLKEGYILTTGDTRLTGESRYAKGLKRFENLSEAINSSTFAYILAATMNRKLLADYNAKGGAYADNGKGWLWNAVPVNDFKNQERTRMGGYGNLSTVAEGAPYDDLSSPTDEKVTYAVAKKGGIETLTFEAIRNDDVGLVRRIPQKMAMAARRTLYEFAFDLLINNVTFDGDSVAVFHTDHANTTTTALSSTTWKAARLAMLKQTEKNSGKRMGLMPQHLIVPPDLEETAVNLFRKTTENDPQFIHDTKVAIHIITHTTDTNNWFVAAGIDQAEQIELGFLDGNENPEIMVADNPTEGSVFSADKTRFKIRHIYGGDVVEFRGLYGGIVA